jgi:hypothetical protein
MESDMSKYVGTTSKVHKCHRAKYRVSFHVEFFRSIDVAAVNEKEATEIAEQRIIQKQTGMLQNGYSLGDIELISVKERE